MIAISHRLWTTRFGASNGILGQSIIADGKPLRIVGVLSREFDFFQDSDILEPLTFSGPGAYDEFARTLEVFGSLRADVEPSLAALQLTSTTRLFRPTQIAMDKGAWVFGQRTADACMVAA